MKIYRGIYSVCEKEVIESDDLKTITLMLENELNRVVADPETWETLYFRKKDLTYWLLSYDNPEMQGGGVKVLTEISGSKASTFKQKHTGSTH